MAGLGATLLPLPRRTLVCREYGVFQPVVKARRTDVVSGPVCVSSVVASARYLLNRGPLLKYTTLLPRLHCATPACETGTLRRLSIDSNAHTPRSRFKRRATWPAIIVRAKVWMCGSSVVEQHVRKKSVCCPSSLTITSAKFNYYSSDDNRVWWSERADRSAWSRWDIYQEHGIKCRVGEPVFRQF